MLSPQISRVQEYPFEAQIPFLHCECSSSEDGGNDTDGSSYDSNSDISWLLVSPLTSSEEDVYKKGTMLQI